jgi:hypothetical protein
MVVGPSESPAKQSVERLPEYLRKYSDEKRSAARSSGALILLSVVVALAARTPSINVDIDAPGVKGGVKASYLLVYGEPLIWVVAVALWLRLIDLRAMYRAIWQTIGSNHDFVLLPVEKVLAAPPRAFFAPLIAFISYCTLIGGFFHDLWKYSFHDLFLGLEGIKASDDLPYVYCFNTWVNVIGFFVMLCFLVCCACTSCRFRRQIKSHQRGTSSGQI